MFEYPSLVDYSSDAYSVNYLITNDTDSPITLSDFKLLNISTNSKIYDPHHGFALCSDKKVTQFKNLDEEFNPHSAPPAGIEGVEFDAKVPKAAKLTVDGADITSLMAIVEPHKASVVAANFVTDKHDYIKWNTTVACPMVKIFFPKIGRKEVLCSGVLMIKFPETQYRDRISQLNYGEYRNPTLATGPGGLGTIFSLDDHMRRVTNDSSENHCHRYTQ